MASEKIRLLIVEDVPQVAQYLRGLLSAQSQVQLLDVVPDGKTAMNAIGRLRPDVVVVDALLRGSVRPVAILTLLHEQGIPGVVLTVPQSPVAVEPERGIAAVLTMPFSGFDLMNAVQVTHQAAAEAAQRGSGRVLAVYGPKGGVGKTTIALNLAVACASLGHATVLVDGSLQFGDLRTLVGAPSDAPSILDLPTDKIGEGDLDDVVFPHPSGVGVVLAPPRIEMAEMVSTRDVEKLLAILPRIADVIVVDLPVAVSEVTLAFLDAADVILEVFTYDSTTLANTLAAVETFRALGYPPAKVRYVANRADSTGGMDPAVVARALGRVPDHTIVSDGQLVVRANNQGTPFVLADPEALVSSDIRALATALVGVPRAAAAAAR